MMDVVAIGGSLVEPGAPLVVAIADLAGDDVAVTARGRRGWSLADWLSHPDDLVAAVAGADAVVVVEWGGNGVPSSSDVRTFQSAIGERGRRRVVWVDPPAWPSGTRVSEARRATLARISTNAVDRIGRHVRLEAGDLQPDGVHLTFAGAGRWRDQVRESLFARGAGLGVLVAAAVAVAVLGGSR